MSENAETGLADAIRRRIDPPVAIAFGCILIMLFLGSLYSSSFLSPEYLLQQLKVASFLGVIAGLLIRFSFYGELFGGGGRNNNNHNNQSALPILLIIMAVSIVVYAISFLLIRLRSRYRGCGTGCAWWESRPRSGPRRRRVGLASSCRIWGSIR